MRRECNRRHERESPSPGAQPDGRHLADDVGGVRSRRSRRATTVREQAQRYGCIQRQRHFLEVFQNTEIPAFTNNERVGNAEENAAVVGGTIGQYGTYTVDENGAFESDIITGSTWPNRNGVQYRTPELTLTVNGDQLTEVLASPGRPMLRIEFVRVP